MDRRYIAGFFDGEGSIGIYRALVGHDSRPVRFHLRTQLVQNKDRRSTELFTELLSHYGGNLSEQRTLSGKSRYNWQLNSDRAVRFLRDILPFLILKREQAEVAIAWQIQRPPLIRNALGQIQRKVPTDLVLDESASELVKELKNAALPDVISRRQDFSDVINRLGLLRSEQSTSEYVVFAA